MYSDAMQKGFEALVKDFDTEPLRVTPQPLG